MFVSFCFLFEANACWSTWYLAEGHYLYRVASKAEEKSETFSRFNPHAENNCREWQRFASLSIPLTDIYEVVYKMPLEDFEKSYRHYRGNNAFLQWLNQPCHQAWEAAEFLLFAKITEDVRGRQNSRWYYPTMKTGGKMPLEAIAEKALGYQGPLRDRYLLQAVRALFSMHRYADCITLWNEEASLLPQESSIRQLMLPYIAGAEYRMGHYDKAVSYFYEAGDIVSMITCSGKDKPASTVETLERIYDFEPDCRFFPDILQEFIQKVEYNRKFRCFDRDWHKYNVVTDEHRRLAHLAIRIAQEGKTANPAMWYYTAAFIEDLDGNTAQASNLLATAERSQGTKFIKESIKVLRIYLNSKLMPYNQDYENHLFSQLQWLDRKIVENLTPAVRETTAEIWSIKENIGYYYWNDVMRRIVLTEVCPRMLAAGKPIRALQLANMADNRLFGLVDRVKVDWKGTTKTMQEFRHNRETFKLDYSNSFFELIDSLGLKQAIAYRRRIEQPLDAFDRFLNARGYVDREYIDDIIGTKYLRAMRYQEAAACLEQISRSFEGHLNTQLECDPFSFKRQSPEDKADFKYRFAREMCMLEQEMKNANDPNRKAEAMFRYAVGLRNSFGQCWCLTQYYLGTTFYGQVQEKRDWAKDPQTVRAIERSAELLQKACSLFTDPELAAQTLQKLYQYRTIIEKYPETETGRYIRSHCDNLVDYAIKWR